MKPIFSIIIPLYNSENYIEETLTSLVNQSYKDFEVLIVDDKSTDGSITITNKFIANHPELNITLFADRPADFPKGVSGSRNYGIHHAKGEWVCFLDSDDLFHPEKLEILHTLIISLQSNTQAIHHQLLEFKDGENVAFEEITNATGYYHPSLDQLVMGNTIATSAVVIKKETLDKTKYFDNELGGVEDYYLWLHVCLHTEWYFLPSKLTLYRVRVGSLMGGRKFEHYITQNSRLVFKINNNTLFSSIHKKKIEEYFMFVVMQYYAIISLRQFGLLNFLNGLYLLTLKGYSKYALKIGLKHTKFFVYKKLAQIKAVIK